MHDEESLLNLKEEAIRREMEGQKMISDLDLKWNTHNTRTNSFKDSWNDSKSRWIERW